MFLDLTKYKCPITFVKAKLALEKLKKNETLTIKINEGEDLDNMPESLKEQYQYFTEANISKLREKAHYTKKLHSLEEGVEDYVVNYLSKEDPYL